ncbi:MAG: cyanophycinase [Rubrivivax sp.]
MSPPLSAHHPLRPLCLALAVALGLCVTAPAGAAGPSPSAPPAGTLVILGGAVKDDHDTLWQAIVQAAGGPGALILVLPTASQNPERAAALAATQLQRRGAQTELLPIAPRWPGSSAGDARQQAQDARWVNLIGRAQGVFMTGGDQDRLMDALRPGGGVPSPVLQAIQALLARGGVVAGTSAGAAVMSETAIRGLDDPFDALRRPLDTQELGTGFGLAPQHVVTDQHFLKRGRVARLVRVLLQGDRSLGLGVEEDSAALLRGHRVQALGARGLLLLDTTEAVVQTVAPLQVQGLRLTYVDRGDQFNLETRRMEPPAHRQRLRTGQAAGQPAFFGDILGDRIIVGAMAHAAEADGRTALGLAWRLQQPLGFEWRISADEQTRAWGGATRDDHSIERLRLDIAPVQMAQPVYRPWVAP